MNFTHVTQNNSKSNDIKLADHIGNVENLNINLPIKKPIKLVQYLLIYLIIFFVGVLFILLFGIAYSAWASGNFQSVDQNILITTIKNSKTSPFVGITFMIIGFFGSIIAAVVHWLIKKPY